ncbi:N-acetylmuramoyl-L-alanine amidase LytC precursor [Eubacteriaceae bacterium CHKCI004]|nr:N-acetylmuramoyl-L-alanine amidase LytC precursor [Eubacteriaceae bacterium CHKCI004]
MEKLCMTAVACLLILSLLAPVSIPAAAAEKTQAAENSQTVESLAGTESQQAADVAAGKNTKKKKKKKTIFIAAGHQERGISSRERLAPGSSATKAKLTSGTSGVSTGIPEYKTNLAIAKAARKALRKAGYKVIMLRTTNKCPLSNQQRTRKANRSGADLHICIHCNAGSSGARGPLVIVPASSRYVGTKIYNRSCRLGSSLISAVSKSTGKRANATIRSNYYTTINWAKIPTVILECGFMSNASEDRQLNSASYQKKIANGIVKGVNKYFKNR